MALSSDTNSPEAGNNDDNPLDDDDVTVVAETPTTKTDFIEAEMDDINIRYEIPFRKGQPHRDDYKIHVKLLQAITQAYDESTVWIYDNKNNRVKSFDAPKWQNKEYYDEHFTLHSETRQ